VAPRLDGHPGLVARAVPAGPGVRPRPRGTLARPPVLLMAVVIAGSCALAGCAGQEQSGSPSARVSTWVSGAAGGAAVGTLEADNANIDQALAHHDAPAAIKTVCALLTNDAETAIGNLPTPDNQLTDDLNHAYEKGAAAGDDCYSGAAGNVALLKRSAQERAALVPLLTTAIDRIESVTGRTPSTSTTQPDGSCSDPFGGCN
jgi:hypothetical protein